MAENQYVIFKLGNEEYGVDIMKVKEISEFKESIKVPNAPYFVDGIINLRGEIIPIINLKKRFNIESQGINSDTRIIVINIRNKNVGFVVDEASQVLRIDEKDIESAPDIIVGVDRQYITGVGKIDDKIVILLDLEKILSDEEKEKLEEMQ
ncbi:purine-binding chemotaxis protein CheW [Caminicella sporogenes DSM 14501]|uniref:Purine-binding chemotaxis protein CheW n=1 Tax=Caminicella sporogenes DSM 14501 TaxID=1121266 RepID=A0A1M6MFV0_9FIRM|nr:chemotaxis protein CheW [Caminicella sporogenes]RKD27568.1 chemotaxis protein CheW [Caminicella sporogenes]WIF94846.1 chemotaxis protein CheW [Caminicella sporogenes]SHJ82243.1 purine-binding chemotaxis protein CheW [Caminicella sporogenes DSM 14501]